MMYCKYTHTPPSRGPGHFALCPKHPENEGAAHKKKGCARPKGQVSKKNVSPDDPFVLHRDHIPALDDGVAVFPRERPSVRRHVPRCLDRANDREVHSRHLRCTALIASLMPAKPENHAAGLTDDHVFCIG